MPTYQYQCKYCGHELEEFQSIKDDPLTFCPECKTENLLRMMGTGGGLIFKGSGFYLTDYKNKKSSEKPEKKQSEGGSEKPQKNESKGGSEKPEKSESKRGSEKPEKKETKSTSDKKEST